MQADIFDVSVQDFQSVIAQGSANKPVLVAFWSAQCDICKLQLPLLEQLQREHHNAFTLARINCDVEHQIVKHFDIKSVPTVYMFVNGQGVDGFAGEQTTPFINDFIKRHLPDPAQLKLDEGQTLLAQGHLEAAKTCFLEARHINPTDNNIALALAQVYLAMGTFEDAKPLLDMIPMADQNALYHNLISELELAQQSSQTPEISALEKRLEETDDKQEIQYQLAIQYNQAGRHAEALNLLYSLLVSDLGYENGAAKKTMLDILATVNEQALVSEYRRKLYSLLY